MPGWINELYPYNLNALPEKQFHPTRKPDLQSYFENWIFRRFTIPFNVTDFKMKQERFPLSIRLGPTNTFLLKGKSGYLMIDTSFPGYLEVLLERLKLLKIEVSEIKYLLLTHHHDDHTGFACKFREISGSSIIVHREAIPALEKGILKSKNHVLNRRVKAVMWAFNKIKRRGKSSIDIQPVIVGPNDIVIDQDVDTTTLKALGFEGTILNTTGHSIDSLSVVMPDGNAFVGDICMNFLNICGLQYRPIFLSDIDLVFASWKSILDAGGKMIFPAHGRAFPATGLSATMKRNKSKPGPLPPD